MKPHTQHTLMFITYIVSISFIAYHVTPWALIVPLMTGWDAECNCEDCESESNSGFPGLED